MKKLFLIVLVAALVIPTAAEAQPSGASYCSRGRLPSLGDAVGREGR